MHNKKFIILSNVLPTLPSGQAIVLNRLLKDNDHSNFILLSNEKISNDFKSPQYRYHYIPRKSIVKKIIHYAPWLNFIGAFFQSQKIAKFIKKEKYELMIACTADLYNLPAAYLACKKAKIKFIPYIFDDYAYQWNGINRYVSKILESWILKNAHCIIVTNEYMQCEYKKRYAIKTEVIHNPCYIYNNLPYETTSLDKDKIDIVYTGSIYAAHYNAFHNLINAIKYLNNYNINLHLYTSQSQDELIENGISGSMIKYYSHLPQHEIRNILCKADVLFLPLAFDSEIDEVIRTSAPGKTGEYLETGKPILVHAPEDSFISWYFKKHKCGVVCTKKDPIVLANMIEELIKNKNISVCIGKNARIQAKKDFDINIIRSKFINLIEKV